MGEVQNPECRIHNADDTIAAIATGAQVAAIGIIRLSGPEAIRLADALFEPLGGKPMARQEERKLVYGKL